jgi:hypothetical protein
MAKGTINRYPLNHHLRSPIPEICSHLMDADFGMKFEQEFSIRSILPAQLNSRRRRDYSTGVDPV